MIKQREDNLTKEEELALGRKVQAMQKVKARLEDPIHEITDEEILILEEGNEAFEILVGNHYNLARQAAHKYHQRTGTKYSIEDLEQDAILALVEATITFNPDKNCRLSTHAYYGITKKVTSTINYQRLVRLPENKMGDYIKISNAQKAYQGLTEEEQAKFNDELDYVYKHVDISEENVNIILRNMQPQVSLNAPIYEEEGELVDTLVDEGAGEEVANAGQIDERILQVLKKLSLYEKDLIAFEYGLYPSSMELEEFKTQYGLTDKEVEREVKKVKKKLKKIGSKK